MICIWAILLLAINGVWLLLTLLTLPGNWLMVATTALLAWWQWDRGMFSPWVLVAIAALAAAGEVVEFIASAVGVRKAGGTRLGGLGALVGGLAGLVAGTFLIPIPLVGSLVGTCAGACVGAMTFEAAGGRGAKQSARLGLAAGAGRLAGTLGKFVIGVLIYLIVAAAAFWP